MQAGPDFYIGMSGWIYEDWKGRFYPADLPGSHWFVYCRQQFNIDLLKKESRFDKLSELSFLW